MVDRLKGDPDMKSLTLLMFMLLAFGGLGCGDDTATTETNCTDAVDNDGDNFTDCQDFDCSDNAACATEIICDDGVDGDGDGDTDCADSDCSGDAACL